MPSRSAPRTVELLARAAEGEQASTEALAALLQAELREIAASFLRRERAGHTLQPTALVNEAFIALVGDAAARNVDRATFVSFAAQAMRRVLVEHARKRAARKRGGAAKRITLSTDIASVGRPALDLLELEEALQALAKLDARQATIVELRFFGGLSVEEVAAALGLSKRSVEADWTLARVWLKRRLGTAR